jgi:hypothetical protein
MLEEKTQTNAPQIDEMNVFERAISMLKPVNGRITSSPLATDSAIQCGSRLWELYRDEFNERSAPDDAEGMLSKWLFIMVLGIQNTVSSTQNRQ